MTACQKGAIQQKAYHACNLDLILCVQALGGQAGFPSCLGCCLVVKMTQRQHSLRQRTTSQVPAIVELQAAPVAFIWKATNT